jgi:hypothetical protein
MESEDGSRKSEVKCLGKDFLTSDFGLRTPDSGLRTHK